jgi:hypothetical protein
MPWQDALQALRPLRLGERKGIGSRQGLKGAKKKTGATSTERSLIFSSLDFRYSATPRCSMQGRQFARLWMLHQIRHEIVCMELVAPVRIRSVKIMEKGTSSCRNAGLVPASTLWGRRYRMQPCLIRGCKPQILKGASFGLKSKGGFCGFSSRFTPTRVPTMNHVEKELGSSWETTS